MDQVTEGFRDRLAQPFVFDLFMGEQVDAEQRDTDIRNDFVLGSAVVAKREDHVVEVGQKDLFVAPVLTFVRRG